MSYAQLREANLHGSDLSGARLLGADLTETDVESAVCVSADFTDAMLRDAYLVDTNLTSAKLRGAVLRSTTLTDARLAYADLSNAVLDHTDFTNADLLRTRLDGARAAAPILAMTRLTATDVTVLCDALPPVSHEGPSAIDFITIALSLRAPDLSGFLQRAGMPEIFVEYMIDCARALEGSLIRKLLQSTFISYGGPDEPFARKLYQALHRNGVTTFFFPEHAKPGQKIGRVVRENVESYDRILLLCSKASLDRPGVQFEIEETLERERRDGGAEYLIPVLLDDHLLSDWKPARSDIARTLRDRVCADFRGAQEDEEVFQAGLRKLIAALRPPDLALWRPPGSLPADP